MHHSQDKALLINERNIEWKREVGSSQSLANQGGNYWYPTQSYEGSRTNNEKKEYKPRKFQKGQEHRKNMNEYHKSRRKRLFFHCDQKFGVGHEFEEVFTSQGGLPPNRKRNHAITFPAIKKTRIEKLVANMLKAGMIRPSISPTQALLF
ncbi:hypothetical protein CR513_51784, partial [Mucuna pruriens]